jgi:transposase
MGAFYSEDLRIRAIKLIEKGRTVSEVSRMLSISRWTIYRWKKQLELTGSMKPRKSVPPPEPSKIKDWDKFQEFIDENEDKTQKKLAETWGGVSHHTISRGLKKIGYTRKKNIFLSRKR